ncbi:MAG: carbohydrate ABC transporter permease [Halobacteriales archaeon]
MLMELVLSATRAAGGLGRWFRRRSIEAPLWERALFYLALGVIAFVSVFPFYWMGVTSFVAESWLYARVPQAVPALSDLSLENYRTLFGAETVPFVQYFLNSLFIGTVSAALGLAFSIFGAYSFARLEYPGRWIFSRGVLVNYMFAGILLVIPIFQIIVLIDLVNSRLGIILTHFIFVIPLGLYLLGNYFRSVPKEIEEAGLMDGYSRLEVIVRITLPMSKPAIVATYMYAFLLSWNEYLYASVILRDQSLYTLPIGIEQLQYAFQNVWGDIMAASVVTTIPVLLIFLYLQKYLVEGLSFGNMD